ncbi:alpha/beta fold hydrolase [Streptomyces turgidiscabies]|uniref:Hydrolase, alpha/beta domain protein n=1 Tax=Streptomyces turgidiscabies (strain Car8) TaxID=698760 RepID=L7F5F2_STRT8|nr:MULTISPECIES: alpha/beta hydrolase [Streptomyces]ELP66813.1 hydrolase, alpha/beta domain protein [Streptomyces turgidiscabies Car8]MDX3491835.1 alpha/beta hydrolase [Streptomyces turgidiscabies]GAQ72049.1 putative hydrolase [Streptomyces turgidiscabies]
MRSGRLTVDGAELYHEVRGAGPALLMISGAGGDAGYYSGIAEGLADAFTVITYDRRGNSRSTGDGGAPMSLSRQAADAHALVAELADGRALVFGNSGGAIIGLTLAARHPECLVGLIAHEPPAVNVLPDDDPGRGFFAELAARYAAGGAPAAGRRFAGTIRGEGSYRWPADLWERFLGNTDHLFRSEWPGFAAFHPDEGALRAAPFPIVLGAGADDRGTYYARPSVEIARRIGVPWVEFPGIHMEFLRHPSLFAAALRVLATQMYATDGRVPDLWRGLPETP